MSSEVPLDLSNESKPKSSNSLKLKVNSNLINGSKSGDKLGVKSKRKSQIVHKVIDKSPEPLVKKQKLFNVGSATASDVNPLQRGKYGLRMLPTQVDYYQSILEDRRVRMYRESSRPTPETERLEEIQIKSDKTKGKPKSNQSLGKYEFEIGDIVWATLPNYKTWFPALIISHLHCKQKAAKKGQTWVYWFGDHQVSEIPKSKIKSFVDNFSELSKGTSSLTSLRVKEALEVLASRAGITFPLDEGVASSSTSVDLEETALISWAKNGFPLKSNSNVGNAFKANPMNPIPSSAASYLPLDSVYSEALKTDERLQQIVYYEVKGTEETEPSNEIPEYKMTQIERVKNKDLPIDKICIACCCDAESLISDASKTLLRHPIFEGGLCRLCYDNIRVTMYAPGADHKNSFCAICGQLGNLVICVNDKCHRVYCHNCIVLLEGPAAHQKVLDTEKWECYVCKPVREEMGLLRVRPNWRFNVKLLFDSLINGLKTANLIEESLNDKKQIRILSLMDGISSAKIALDQLGLQTDAYFASESDTDGIEISKLNHKNTILYIESIENITIEKIASISPIDLVLGSSPPEYSSTGSGRKSLIDNKRSGHFFLYFNHIIHLLRLANKSRHVFFLCENSNPLNPSQRDIISNLFMCKPITLFANDFSQKRNRYYWSNIPGIKRPLPQTIQEKFIRVINILAQNMSRKQDSDKSPISPKSSKKLVENESEDKCFEPNQLEKLFDLKHNYTDVSDVTKSKKQSLLSRSWCVSILCHLLWSLTDFYLTSDQKFE